MPLDYKTCACGRVYRDWRRKTCRQCRLREHECPVCDRIHRSDHRTCSACARATVGLYYPAGHHRQRKGAGDRMARRRARIERDKLRDRSLVTGGGGLRSRRLALAKQGVRICALCHGEHHDQTAALCRQCRLVDHADCADCHRPYRGEPSQRRCNSCRQRAKRARQRQNRAIVT